MSSKAVTGVLALAVAVALSQDPPGHRSQRTEGETEDWGYAKRCGALGPEQWSLDYTECASSSDGDQSPIDLDCGMSTNGANFTTTAAAEAEAEVRYSNTGHSVMGEMVVPGAGPIFSTTMVEIAGQSPPTKQYILAQYHWHWRALRDDRGSEHSVDGKFFPMEMHMVTYSDDYGNFSEAVASGNSAALMVLAIFFELGNSDHPALGAMIRLMNSTDVRGEEGGGIKPGTNATTTVDACAFLPGAQCGNLTEFYFYQGGLTTPPCQLADATVVHWVVGTAVSRFSRRQLDFLQNSFLTPAGHGGPSEATGRGSEGTPISTDGNSRPPQCRGRRQIYWSGTGNKTDCDTAAECGPEPTPEPVEECEEEEKPEHLMTKAVIGAIAAGSAFGTTVLCLVGLWCRLGARKSRRHEFSNPGFGQVHE